MTADDISGAGAGVKLLAITEYDNWGTYTYAKATHNPVYIVVELVGGGGDMIGSGALNAGWAHGGGGGGYSKKKILASALGASETVQVGGAGRGTSGAGSDSWFGTAPFLTGHGGTRGEGTPYTGTGVGGLAVGGDVNIQGGYGAISQIGDFVLGGGTYFGGAGALAGAAVNSGAWGTGASGSSGVSKSGTDGVVIVYEYG
ncbi:MAG: hypothetical protein ACYDHZ_12285 [Dehalococcoidia bacterium]